MAQRRQNKKQIDVSPRKEHMIKEPSNILIHKGNLNLEYRCKIDTYLLKDLDQMTREFQSMDTNNEPFQKE